MARFLLVTCLFMAVYANSVLSGPQGDYVKKMEYVLGKSKPDVVPIHSRPVDVTLGLDLTAIREVDITRGEVEITAMVNLMWKNPLLAWKNKVRGVSGADPVHIDIKKLWSPDIAAYNSVHAPELLSPSLAIVKGDGSVLYIPNERIRFQCDLDKFETREGANCTLVYGSWTYHGGILNVKGDTVTTESLRDDARFDLLNTYIETEVKHYPCCPEPYYTVKITLQIRKKRFSLFWW